MQEIVHYLPPSATRLHTSAEPPEAPPLSGEHLLVAAIVRQAFADAQSPVPWRHRPARDFFANADGLTWWNELCGLPEGTLHRYAAQLGTGTEVRR